MQPMLTATETCTRLNISDSTFKRFTSKDPTFPAYKIGGSWRVDRAELKDWIHSKQGGSRNPEPIIIKKRLGRPLLSGTCPR